MKRCLLGLLFTLLLALPASASLTNVYIAQSSAGSADGTSCANAYAVTFFNTSGNWGSGSSQIGPGTTVHLCGTFTFSAGATALTFNGSGTSGNPITLLWESGAVLQAPYFSAATFGINGNGASYVVINGGTNGVIQNTANGTSLTYQQQSTYIGGFGSNFQVENLSMPNVYVHTANDDGGGGSWGIEIQGQSNVTIGPGNSFSQCDVCIFDDWTNANNSNLTIYNNNFSHANQDMEFGFYPAGTFTNVYIYGNTADTWNNWDTADDAFHHNFVHLFTNLSGASITGDIWIYNNVAVGNIGANATSIVYLENNNGGAGGSIGTSYIFNNVFSKTNANVPTSTGIVSMLGFNGGYILNNTIIDAGGTGSNAYNCINIYQNGWTVKNNIELGCGTYIWQQGSGITASNNDYYGASVPQWIYISSYYSALNSWQSGCGCDASSISSNPNLNGSYVPGSGSPVIGAGVNLSSLGITPLDSDAAGNARGSGAWTMGAYNSSGGGPTYTLTVTNTNGSVSGTNCSTGTYASGTGIGACTASPNSGYTFSGWSGTGSCSGASGTGTASCTLTSNSTLTATFAPVGSYSLTVTHTNGTVSGSNCSTGSYSSGTSIGACSASPNSGYTFTGWSGTGSCSGTSGTGTASCTLNSNSTLTATFTAIGSYSLTVTNAHGSVSGTDCATGSYSAGSAIGACTASPNTGYTFTGWSGTGSCSGASGTGTASCTLNSNSTLTATFTINTYTLTVTALGGSVSGTNCATGTYNYYTGIGPCTATPGGGYTFTGWSGTGSCSGASGTGTASCTLTANSTLVATFSGAAATPTFSPGGGNYSSTQTVTISDATPSSTIYYTTDGSTPTTGSFVYSTPLSISVTTTVKAIATASGYSNSAVGSATYNIGPAPPTNFRVVGAMKIKGGFKVAPH